MCGIYRATFEGGTDLGIEPVNNGATSYCQKNDACGLSAKSVFPGNQGGFQHTRWATKNMAEYQ